MATIKDGLAKVNLTLTSPLMKGPEVKNAQWLLDHNRYKLDFQPGVHDSQYGEHTAAATHRAKHLLGYPKRRINSNFGPKLYGYLVELTAPHAVKRPLSYQVRGALRVRKWKKSQAKLHSKRLRAVALALTQLGINEYPPYSNRVKYSEWYGLTGPWCAMFVSWCFSEVGRPMRYAAVSNIYYDAKYHRNGLSFVGSPEKGDLVILDNLGHVGIFLEWVDGSYFKYVSGNTGSGSVADGGEVAVHTLPRSIVNAWVRVN